MEKRYYWLKFKEDFFQSKRIKKLRKLAGGDTFTIIYLKLQLLALKTGGVLTYTGLETSFAEEVALDIDEDADNVAITIKYLLGCGLMETSDNENFSLPYVIENTGSQTSSTSRVADFRARQKALQCNTDVTECNADVTDVKQNRNGEIEKEKELDKDKELERDKTPLPPTRGKRSKPEVDFESLPSMTERTEETLKRWIAFRKEIRKPITQSSAEQLVKKSKEVGDVRFEEVINTSIANAWQGLYWEKKTSNTTEKRNSTDEVTRILKKWSIEDEQAGNIGDTEDSDGLIF